MIIYVHIIHTYIYIYIHTYTYYLDIDEYVFDDVHLQNQQTLYPEGHRSTHVSPMDPLNPIASATIGGSAKS